MTYLMEMIGYHVQGTAEWRREKAEQFPRDADRNLLAAEELDRLAAQIEAVKSSEPIYQRFCDMHQRVNDADPGGQIWMDAGEDLSVELRAIGFHTGYETAAEFLGWYCDTLQEKLDKRNEDAIEEQVDDDPAVEAAERALAEAKQAVDEARSRARAKTRARQKTIDSLKS